MNIEKMKKILEGKFYRMPRGLNRNERRMYMRFVAVAQ